MIPEFSYDEFGMWAECQPREPARTRAGILCERLTGDSPDIIECWLREKSEGVEIGNWIYFNEFGKIIRISTKPPEPKQHDPDKDVLIIRTKSNGSTTEITRRELKMASGEAESLLKPEYPIFTGGQ